MSLTDYLHFVAFWASVGTVLALLLVWTLCD